jgi:hypothetical protein
LRSQRPAGTVTQARSCRSLGGSESGDRAIIGLEQGDYEELDQLNAANPYAKAAYRINRPKTSASALRGDRGGGANALTS